MNSSSVFSFNTEIEASVVKDALSLEGINSRIVSRYDRHDKLGEVYYFTFEPHISKKNGKWGFKYENVYFFDIEGELQEL